MLDSFKASYIGLGLNGTKIDLEYFGQTAKEETKTIVLFEQDISDGASLDFSDFSKLESLEIGTENQLSVLRLLKINHSVLKIIKFLDIYTFNVDVESLEKVIESESGCKCLKFEKCRYIEETIKILLGMNEDEALVAGQEYTFEIKDHSVNMVKSQMPGHQNKFKYELTYAEGN